MSHSIVEPSLDGQIQFRNVLNEILAKHNPGWRDQGGLGKT
ncbi:Uncharacterised protein [Mycobacterium tuberculosis]|nr:Uncharacterised protein [Mycobacterium tuberculosis]